MSEGLRKGEWNELPAGEGGERLDVFVARMAQVSRSQAQKLIDEGHVKLNGEPPRKAGLLLEPGDVASVFLPKPRPSGLAAQEIPLEIVFQDEHLAVIEKPAGLVVHPAAGHDDGTLVNALLHHLPDLSKGSGVGGELRPGIVHRIDRWTSGILLVTKTDEAHQALSAQFKAHTITRRYLGVCWGRLPTEGEWDAPLARDPKERKRMAIVEGGRRAVTRYKALEHFGSTATYFQAELLTGRTHQVRVHFAAHGYPLLGDETYGNISRPGKQKRDQGLAALRKTELWPSVSALEEKGRQFLHAAHLAFDHPATGARLEFSSELPPELGAVVLGLREWKA